MSISRTEALNLSTAAMDIGADVLRGHLRPAPEGAGWVLGDTDLEQSLEKYEGQELVIVIASIGPKSVEKNTCKTCGTEYTGNQCPNCREIRLRLRGRNK